LLEIQEMDLPKRTLQRRINRLLGENRLVARGDGRGRRYFVAERPPVVRQVELPSPTDPQLAWLSPEAREIRDQIRKPISERTPVGYGGLFLDAYLPNETFYLPSSIRQQLADIGQVGPSELPAGTYLRKILDRLIIDLSWNSSRLEGNTYSLLDTHRLLQLGESAEGRAAEEAQMILNHKGAIEMLSEQADEIGFNRYTICNLHALLADNLLPDPAACGRIRSIPVSIAGTVFHPLEVPQAIENRFDQILEMAARIEDAFEQAFFVMVHLPYLQPFEDVNKRVSRLAANIPLVTHNLCPLSFVDVPMEEYVGGLVVIYEQQRIEYLRDVFVWAYQRSCARYAAIRQSLSEPDRFRLKYQQAISRFVREVVQRKMDKGFAAKWIARTAEEEIPEPDRPRFVEIVETELLSLHMGSIARYRIRPVEFEGWSVGW